MNVLLQFDYESHLLHIPDGYISDIRDTFDEFFSWLYEQEENMLETPDGHIGCAYRDASNPAHNCSRSSLECQEYRQ